MTTAYPPVLGSRTTRSAFVLLTAASLWILSMGCSPASPDGPDAGNEASVAQAAAATIGPQGGVVQTADGSSISVPSGALAGYVSLSIESDGSAVFPVDVTPVGRVYLLGPEGQQFKSPVTVTVAVDPSELPEGSSIEDVVMYTAPRDSLEYVPLPTFSVDGEHVSARTTHFSHFVAVIPHMRNKVFGLGGDAYNAVAPPAGAPYAHNHDLFNGLEDYWKTKHFALKSARIVWSIDQVACPWEPNLPADYHCGLPQASTVSLTQDEWIANSQPWVTGVVPDAGDTAESPWTGSLAYWVKSVAAAGLTPAVSIQVNCKKTAGTDKCLSDAQFRDRFQYLLTQFPKVKFWGLVNEPDLNVTGERGRFDADRAVHFYIDGATILRDLQRNGTPTQKHDARDVSLFVAEFAGVDPRDWPAYGEEMWRQVEAAPAPRYFPAYWGLHPYVDTTSGNTDLTDQYVKFLDGLENERHLPHGSLRVWLTETGTMLEWGGLDCHDTDSGYGADATKKQFDAADTVYALAAMQRVDRVYWWQFQAQQCDTGMQGGGWDSALVDANGNPRPAYCALTRQDASHCDGQTFSRDCGGPGINGCSPAASAAPPETCYGYVGEYPVTTCIQVTANQPGFQCTAPGEKVGSCTTKDLVGCCDSTVPFNGSYTESTAYCFYDAATAAAAEKSCKAPAVWRTSP